MARAIRIDVGNGWYHVTGRGIERREMLGEARECVHLLELLEEMSERYGVEVHAYALMGNHYHLLIRTPEANASRAMHWLNVSYSVWFNKRRQRAGPVFQGRFGSVLVDGNGSWSLNASVYIHLNPLRTAGYGLGKAANRGEGLGLVKPAGEAVKRRLKALREFRWSSYPAYAGYEGKPEWLHTEELLRRAGGSQKYRRYVQGHVTRGIDPEGYEDLAGRVALGAREFLNTLGGLVKRVTKEQPARKQLDRRVSVEAVVRLVEKRRGEKWADFSNRHGDWGRDLVLYLARKRSGLTLGEIGQALGGLEYKTVGKALQRFEASLAEDRAKQAVARQCLKEMSNVET